MFSEVSRRELLFAVGFALVAVGETRLRGLESRPALLALGLLVPLSLAWRVRAPVPVLAFNLAASAVIELVSEHDDYPVTLGLVLLVAVYSAGAHAHGRSAGAAAFVLVAAPLGLAAARLTDLDWHDPSGRSNLVIGLVFLAVAFRGAWLAGRWTRRRREHEHELTQAALREERARIARELHDVLAHAISVVVLQARGARHALVTRPDEARAAIDAIDRTASQALAEMRRLLAVLRADDEAAALAPQPSLAHVEALVGEVRAAGLPVELEVEGELRELPPGVDLCAYRIVQEALTNALRHAGPAEARVRLRRRGDTLEVEVADTGAGAANGEAAGLGLAGMRERVAVFGGRLENGPRPGGGYLVSASLPL